MSGYSVNSENIYISWSPPLPELRNGEIRYYIISSEETETGMTTNHTSTKTEFTLVSLHPYYGYDIIVAAVTVTPGPFSVRVTIWTKQDGMYYSSCMIDQHCVMDLL